MTTHMIGGTLLKNTHLNIRIPFEKVTLNKACGYGALASIVYMAGAIAKGLNRQFAAGAFAFFAFGGCYAYTRKNEGEDIKVQNEHDETLAKIKHPRSSEKKNSDMEVRTEESQSATHNGNESSGIEFLIPPVIRKDGFTLIFGDKGTGKSILSRQIATCISTGAPCPAFPKYAPAKPQKVILLDAELTKADHSARGYMNQPNLECYASDEFNYRSVEDMLNDIERLVNECSEDCTVIFDCISSPKFGLSLSSPSDVAALDNGIKAIRQRAHTSGYSVNFIAINHANKSDTDVMRGGTGLIQNATSVLQISKIDRLPGYRKISIVHNRSGIEALSWIVRLIPPTEEAEIHYEVDEAYAKDSVDPSNNLHKDSEDQDYAKYLQVKELVDYYRRSGTKSFWHIIGVETGVTKQCFNNWKKKYADVWFNLESEESVDVDD